MPTTSRTGDLTPDQRRRQVAALLARGVVRCCQLARRAASSLPAPKLNAPDLEVSADTRLSVSRRSRR